MKLVPLKIHIEGDPKHDVLHIEVLIPDLVRFFVKPNASSYWVVAHFLGDVQLHYDEADCVSLCQLEDDAISDDTYAAACVGGALVRALNKLNTTDYVAVSSMISDALENINES